MRCGGEGMVGEGRGWWGKGGCGGEEGVDGKKARVNPWSPQWSPRHMYMYQLKQLS